MPSYNLPHFPFIASPSPSPPSSSPPQIHAPKPVRPAFVPLPIPPTTAAAAAAEEEGRPSSPGKRRRRRRDSEGFEEGGAKTGRRVEIVAVGSAGAVSEKENRPVVGQLPDTPPATPTLEQQAVAEEHSRRSGGRHARSPSEGHSRHRSYGQHHRRSSSVSSISFSAPPFQHRPSSPTPGRVAPPPPHPVHLLAVRLRRAPPHSSPLARSVVTAPPPGEEPRGRSPSPNAAVTAAGGHRPPRPPLSRRYSRPYHLAHRSARSSVQQNSLPSHLTPAFSPLFPSILPEADPSPSASTSSAAATSPSDALFAEYSVLHTLHRRLSTRLSLARGNALGERAGLGGLKAGREMFLWAACVRAVETEERRRRVWSGEERGWVPEVARPEGAHKHRVLGGWEGGGVGAAPLGGLPGEASFGGRGGGRGGRSLVHFDASSNVPPPSPPDDPLPGSPQYEEQQQRHRERPAKHHRRLSSLSLPSFGPLPSFGSLPSLKRSVSLPAPSPSPSAEPPVHEPHPFLLRRSLSDPSASASTARSSSGYGFAPQDEDDLPLTIRARLPRVVEKAVLRPEACQASSSSSLSPSSPSAAPSTEKPRSSLDALFASDFPSSYSSTALSLPSPPPLRPSSLLPRSSLRLPPFPRTIPLAPPSHEKRSLLPSHLVLNLGAGRAGGRSGRGLEDWSRGCGVGGYSLGMGAAAVAVV
ncbi:hypothetical protein JCM6882_009159 [Rhodosporidiobolus microsporus]